VGKILRYIIGFACMGALFWVSITLMFPRPCVKPIEYSLGTLDARFNMPEKDMLGIIQDAEKLWEVPAQKELFTYNPDSSFAINFIYDNRQERTDQARTITNSLQKTSKTHQDLKEKYSSALAQYNKAKSAYIGNESSYESQVRALNASIQKQNVSGGASEEEYEVLQVQQRALLTKKNALEQERRSLNALAEQVNTLADTEEQIVRTYNATVENLSDTFGDEEEFGQGEYNGKSITIYEFTNKKDLTLVLAHEFGHALGLTHVSNPNSIMYYLVNEDNLGSQVITNDDKAALDAECKKTSLQVYGERLVGAYGNFVEQYK
jgi:uncharacterized protein YqeY